MAPGTNIGSASPVFMGADGDTGDEDDTMTRKVTNDAVAQIVNLANLRGRNAVTAHRDREGPGTTVAKICRRRAHHQATAVEDPVTPCAPTVPPRAPRSVR